MACYRCNNKESSGHLLKCLSCCNSIHFDCLKSGRPSPIEGDVFFDIICGECDASGKEQFRRIKLPWITVVHLALYNLQLEGGGKFGFFKWKDSICTYIDRHWHNFFQGDKKRSATWPGTVAGVLSNGSPQYFTSGSATLKQAGWWKLTENKPPTLESVLQLTKVNKKSGRSTYKEPNSTDAVLDERRSSRAKLSSIEAAIQLKARRDMTLEAKEIKRKSSETETLSSQHNTQHLYIVHHGEIKVPGTERNIAEVLSEIKQEPVSEDFMESEPSVVQESRQTSCIDSVSQLLGGVNTDDSDLEIDPCSLSPVSQSFTVGHTDMTDAATPSSFGTDGQTEKEVPSTYSGQSWDQIMATFCDTAKGTNTLIKEEPIEENERSDSAFHHDTVSRQPPQDDDSSDLAVLQKQSVPHTPASDTEHSFDLSSVKLEPQDTVNYPSRPSSQCYSTLDSERATTSCDTSRCQSEADSESEVDESGSLHTEHSECHKPQRKKRKLKPTSSENISEKPQVESYTTLSLYEEKQLLKTLQTLGSVVDANPQACRLRRKLRLREIKRERGLPCFDLDGIMNKLMGQKSQLYGIHINQTQPNIKQEPPDYTSKMSDVRILDRFQTHHHIKPQHLGVSSFLNKLVGTDDDQLQSIRSPYTARLLKPFIRRDYESCPLKLQLLREIQAHYHRDDPSWEPPPRLPIDYCYVQPQHIPSVNTLCREFFWPGIDLSECLQYPDFSCVVLYRKFVIGFAFMVPDVKHNEAYISFIFTHPEWRRAGIAKFMLYHLIQTCMGKDVTLHVSASNPAMLLYQQFGFKPEEFILDFYDKYFPLESKDSRHAFFLRLRR